MSEHTFSRCRRRSGFTLIELITAMLAATVLLTGMAATVVISTQLLEVPPSDDSIWNDRYIADRLASDLRYATSVDETPSYGFQITKPNADTGSPENVDYEAYLDGLTRQVDAGPVMHLDADAPTQQFQVDGYTGPTYIPPPTDVRVRSSSKATTDFAVSSIDIDLPPGCKAGDLVLLCVSAKTPLTLTPVGPQWQTVQARSTGDLRMLVAYGIYNDSWSAGERINSSPDSAMSAAMIAVENVDVASPIGWSDGDGGFALNLLPLTYPTPLEGTGYNRRKLNVQIFSADFDPWNAGTLGMASFADVIQATAAPANPTLTNSIAVAVRNGATPNLSTAPSVLHQATGFWLQTALRVEAEP